MMKWKNKTHYVSFFESNFNNVKNWKILINVRG